MFVNNKLPVWYGEMRECVVIALAMKGVAVFAYQARKNVPIH
jgi:hypothetical protein